MAEPRALDATSLAGLAHPLRLQLLEALTVHGPATASDLARRLGESSGATSYHLRQLERHGFVEEDPGRGNRRERWWRAVRQNTRLRASDFADDPAMAEAQRLVSGEWLRSRQARLNDWVAVREQWPTPWRDASAVSTTHLVLSLEETARLRDELQDVLMRWAERLCDRDAASPDEGAHTVEVQVNLFPNGEPVTPGPDGTAAPAADPPPG